MNEILDFCSFFAIGFRPPPRLAMLVLPGGGCLSGLVGGADNATDKTRPMNSFWSIFITAVEADLSFTNST